MNAYEDEIETRIEIFRDDEYFQRDNPGMTPQHERDLAIDDIIAMERDRGGALCPGHSEYAKWGRIYRAAIKERMATA